MDFSKTIMKERQTEGHRIVDTIAVSSLPLYQILNEHLPFEQKIDFLSVDVEGFDLQVLESNDWDKYRPRVILVEIMNSSLNSLINESIYQFLVSKGYRLFAKLVYTCIFKIEDNLTE